MRNTSMELVPSSQWQYQICIRERYFGIMFCYTIMMLCIFVGTAAHSWCLWFYFSVDWKNKPTQIFLLHYIIMELVLCIQCAIEILNVFFFNNYIVYLFGFFIFGLSWSGRPIMQICICVEQYLAVIYPVMFLRYKGRKYRCTAVATAWLVASGCGLYYTFGPFYYYLSVPVFLMAVSVISFCCVSVLCALKHPGPGKTNITKTIGRDVGNQQKKNAFKTILSALLMVVLTYVPQVFILLCSLNEIDQTMFECNIVYTVTAINIFTVLITPFMKLYKECYEKYVKCPNDIKEIS